MSEKLKCIGEEFLEAKKLFETNQHEEGVKKIDYIMNYLKDLSKNEKIDSDIKETIPNIYDSLSRAKEEDYSVPSFEEFLEGSSKVFKEFAKMNKSG